VSTLFSYVVDHDTGFAPNPYGGLCTLVHCKFRKASNRKRNIVELAEKDDWIIGTGGQGTKSCGNGWVVYIMRVDEKIPFAYYLRDPRFHGRADQVDRHDGNQYALISQTFFYFGKSRILRVSDIPAANLDHAIEKKGRGFRSHFPESFVRQFAAWVQRKYAVGMHGEPCAPRSGGIYPGCPSARKASVCRCTTPRSRGVGANRILLLRVGMDLGFGGLGPLFADGRFEYVPIPENAKKTCSRSVRFSLIPARSGGTLGQFVPPRYRGAAAHYDPEFDTFTYGDPTPNKRRQLLRLAPNDILVFYAGLRPPHEHRGSRLYVIGYFTLHDVHDVTSVEPWPPPALKHLWANAHFRRSKPDLGLVVVEGVLQKSRLLEQAVPLSDDRQMVLPDMERRLGLTGSVMRAGAGRWVPATHVPGVEKWLRTLLDRRQRQPAICGGTRQSMRRVLPA
jgi:hypothetical protein